MIPHRDPEARRKRMHQNLAEPANGMRPIPHLQLTGKHAGLLLNVPVAAFGPAAGLRESSFPEFRAPVSSR
jgi:hypothetical protein